MKVSVIQIKLASNFTIYPLFYKYKLKEDFVNKEDVYDFDAYQILFIKIIIGYKQ